MKIKKFISEERGAVLPFVAIILGLFGLGFMALVIDAGFLYTERKAMVTSADAAALAGANVLRESLGKDTETAKAVAKEYAIKNGADEEQVDVFVGDKIVTLPNGSTEKRKIVEVNVGVNEEGLFSRFLGSSDTDVEANAIATWGYIKKAYVGEFIPLFVFDEDYKLNTDIYLHENIEGTNGYGFINVGQGMNGIKEAIAGEKVNGAFIYNNLLDGKPGNGSSLLGAVEERMVNAAKRETAEERKKAMTGLVPVIDKKAFSEIEGNDKKNANAWKLPIKYFAVYEIIDVIKQNTTKGSVKALNPDNEYKRRGNAVDYSGKIPSQLLKNNRGAENVLIIGRFTGEIVDARTIAEAGDQISPNPDGDTPATYSKLIK